MQNFKCAEKAIYGILINRCEFCAEALNSHETAATAREILEFLYDEGNLTGLAKPLSPLTTHDIGLAE